VKLRALGALLALAAMATSASAASVILFSTNTGQTTNPAQGSTGTNSPQSTAPPVRGLLLAIDFAADGLGTVFTAVQDLEVSGPLVQWTAPIYAADNTLPSDDVQTRSLALLVNADGQDQPPGASNFLREDSYWWDSAQTIGGQSRSWSPVATGIEDGAPGDDLMTMTATLGSVGQNTPQGIAKLIYVVTTGDLEIRGVIARTSDPQNATDTGGGAVGAGYMLYHYDTNTLEYVPEPSSFVLAGLGVVALAVGAWRRRK
jgi:hypothetical protein